MVLNTLTVSAAVTPTVIKTYGSHYLKRKSRRQKPTAHISYDEGLHLIRAFLLYASHHTVEEVQAFTAQWVPSPRWVRTEEVTIPEEMSTKAADALIAQLGQKGVDRVGGKAWWQWRRDNKPLKAEWIEMRSNYNNRKKSGEKCTRVMLYVHGGAYFFGSVDEHRYQMQRHARKLKARVFAPRYRLAPQFPFPCGLQDSLAAYLHLLTIQDPSTILLAGDSAGGGMVLSLLVTLRDQGLPLPAGAILISPWVDLTHSFPSVAGSGERDYIPEYGFFQRPSAAWPPPNVDDMKEISMGAVGKVALAELPRKSTQEQRSKAAEEAIQGFSITPASPKLPPEGDPKPTDSKSPRLSFQGLGSPRKSISSNRADAIPDSLGALSIEIDGKRYEIKDQIQMYATNTLISHPLVSPVLQPSLGGLPPMLIQVGGGEMLRDEQIYLAHKAANPTKYPAPDWVLRELESNAHEQISKHRPTDVQLQVWDDLCHVTPTLSFTRPAKFMYRSIAQFGAWALAHAQRTEIEIMNDDELSIISSGSDTGTESEAEDEREKTTEDAATSEEEVGKAGDPLPPFKGHMIRQRIDRHGVIHPLGPPSSLEALQVETNEIGRIKPGTVRKWLKAKQTWDRKYAREKRSVQRQRIKEMVKGYQSFDNDEVPPPSALAGRRGQDMPKESKKKRSMGMSLWSLWGSSHDKETLERETQTQTQTSKDNEITVASPTSAQSTNRRRSKASTQQPQSAAQLAKSRSRSHVRDLGQASHQGNDGHVDENTTAAELIQWRHGDTLEPSTSAVSILGPTAADSNALRPSASATSATSLSPDFVHLEAPPMANGAIKEVASATDTTNTNGTVAEQHANPTLVLPGTNVTLDGPDDTRPKAGGVAFPFKLGRNLEILGDNPANASTVTLTSEHVFTPTEADDEKQLRTSENSDGVVASARPVPERFETAQELL